MFAVTSGASLTLNNLTLTGGNATGQAGQKGFSETTAGSGGGGGAAGLGGAVFVDGGQFTAVADTFTSNTAQGGAGGTGGSSGGGTTEVNGGHGGGLELGNAPGFGLGGVGGAGGSVPAALLQVASVAVAVELPRGP